MKMKTVQDICRFIGSQIEHPAVCVETGCTYVCWPGNEVHTTTNNIYELVAKGTGSFYSLDRDPAHLDFAQDFVKDIAASLGGNKPNFIECDSVEGLEHLSLTNFKWNGTFVDLLCLDSLDFDEDHMVNEFRAIEASLRPDKHFILVDDIHNVNSTKFIKMVPLLKERGYQTIEVPTPTGMLVASKGYALP